MLSHKKRARRRWAHLNRTCLGGRIKTFSIQIVSKMDFVISWNRLARSFSLSLSLPWPHETLLPTIRGVAGARECENKTLKCSGQMPHGIFINYFCTVKTSFEGHFEAMRIGFNFFECFSCCFTFFSSLFWRRATTASSLRVFPFKMFTI